MVWRQEEIDRLERLQARIIYCGQWLRDLARQVLPYDAGSGDLVVAGDTLAVFNPEQQVERTAFAYSIAGVAALLMQADDPANAEEEAAFIQLFSINGLEPETLNRLLQATLQNPGTLTQHAWHIERQCQLQPHLAEHIVLRLARLALVDGYIVRTEYDVLLAFARACNLSVEDVARIVDEAHGVVSGTPHALLQLAPDATQEQITKQWRNLMRSSHPDRWPDYAPYSAFRALCEARCKRLNAAHEQLTHL